jgi:hypothetical protein
MAEPVVPAGLKPIERFIKTAKQLEKHDPIFAYYCMLIYDHNAAN